MITYRKAQQTGASNIGAITVTLPISWVRAQGIEKGQLMAIANMGNKLVITKAKMEE